MRNLGLKPIIMSFPVLWIISSAFMEPKLEFNFNSMVLSPTFKIRGFLSFSRIKMVARSIQSKNSFLLIVTFVS